MIKKITDYLVINGIIEYDEKEIYSYGLYQGFHIVLNIITTMLVGFIFGRPWEIIIFMTAYIPLRMYGGGYHARTQLRCYFLSVALIMGALLLIKFIPITRLSILTISSISSAVVYILAPVEDKNKVLNDKENRIYRRKTRTLLAIEILIAIVLYMLGLKKYALVISVGIFVLSLMMIAGRIKNFNM